jgi:uncharacterized metal-binding protein YceD (DUF177 family)
MLKLKSLDFHPFSKVHTQYRPLRLNVGFLLSQTAGYGREFDFRESKITISNEIPVENFTGHIVLSRTAQGIVAQGEFGGEIPAECARCLREFATPVSIHLEDLFVYPPQNATDPLLAIGEDAHLNLEPLVREYLLINQPSRPLHSPDCKGLCPICGADLNETKDHRHAEEELTPVPERIRIIAAEPEKTAAAAAAEPARAASASGGGKKTPAKRTAVKKRTARAKPAARGQRKKSTGGKRPAAAKKRPAPARKKSATKK